MILVTQVQTGFSATCVVWQAGRVTDSCWTVGCSACLVVGQGGVMLGSVVP